MATLLTTENWKLALRDLREFIGPAQRRVLAEMAHEDCEEHEFFRDKLVALAALIAAMPKTYEQDGKDGEALVTLHYFTGGCDWWITEKDKGTPEEPGQHQAFGLADLGHGAELGYISIAELLANGAELDLYFTPCTIASLEAKKEKHSPVPSTS